MANFAEKEIQTVWEKGIEVDNSDSNKLRKDMCGAWIQRDQYGMEGAFGWEIDHVYPESKGGSDELINLRPMQWENNRSKNDDYPNYTCAMTSKNNSNIPTDQGKTVNEALQGKLKKLYNI